MNTMTNEEVKTYRSVANRALYAAQYIAAVHGDKRYLQAISRFFVSTETDLQPVVRDIFEFLVHGDRSKPAVKLALDTFAYCAQQYDDNSAIINAWLNTQRASAVQSHYQQLFSK